jgi:hypothetical protein
MLSSIVATPIFSYAHKFGELRGLVKKEGQLLLLLTAIRSDDHKLFLLEFYEPLQDLMLPWDFRKISLPSWRPRFKNHYSVRISLDFLILDRKRWNSSICADNSYFLSSKIHDIFILCNKQKPKLEARINHSPHNARLQTGKLNCSPSCLPNGFVNPYK